MVLQTVLWIAAAAMLFVLVSRRRKRKAVR